MAGPREEEVQFEQDNQGNERRKLDTVRAQEGNAGGLTGGEGLAEIGSADTGGSVLVYSKPTRATQYYVTRINAFNSVGSGDNTFFLEEQTLDGSNSVSSSEQRSVPFSVASGATREIVYEGLAFDKAAGVVSEFEGQIGISVLVDHEQSDEPNTVQTDAP